MIRTSEEIDEILRLSREKMEREARERRNLAARAKRRGVPVAVLEQREWIKANPCGFEIG